MITEAKFKHALKEMMKEQELEDINVTALCARCNCHRQTFYYHYQDIYDLIATIFLTEDLGKFDNSKTIKDALKAFLAYAKENFAFLKQTYNSAARNLTDDFLVGKFNVKMFNVLMNDETVELKTEGKRVVARRFASAVSDEFGNCFKDKKIVADRFVKRMQRYIENAVTVLLPAYIELSKKEEAKHD